MNKALLQIATKMTTSKLLKSTSGNITADSITKTEFINEAESLSEQIDNRYDKYIMYIADGKLVAKYYANDLLALLGLGNHMGIGIPSELLELTLSD